MITNIEIDSLLIKFDFVHQLGTIKVKIDRHDTDRFNKEKAFATDSQIFGRNYDRTDHAHQECRKIIMNDLSRLLDSNKWTLWDL